MSHLSQTDGADMDALLQETWLQVISLKHGPTFKEGEGLALWQRCEQNVERVQQALREAGMSEESRRDILLAQCALLDETVKSRGQQDDALVQWYNMPLQGRFLHTIDAGNTLCDRMKHLLNQPGADEQVLICFHRVMMLGFVGGYASPDAEDRKRLIQRLSERVPPFAAQATRPILMKSEAGAGNGILRLWPVRIGLGVLVLAGVWWGLSSWLDHLIATLLPDVKL
ncbi:hypothetical protein CIG19_06650 [Enterobacterales bacterium CwR94]|nr:hypothetical protein CIG19_06650 [Enterobacterales bacterium CwR94]